MTAARPRGPMQSVGRVLRSSAAVLAGLALLAIVPTCPCPEKTAPARSEHACCAPPTGVSASDPGCCGGPARTQTDLLTPGPLPAPAPAAVAVLRADAVVRLAPCAHRSPLTSPSPPPAILRI